MAAYQGLTNAATQTAGNPLQQYSGPIVAGFTPQQQQGFSEIGNLQGVGVPYLNAAAQQFGTATTPLWPTLPQYSASTVNQYLNPYTQDVTKALTDLYNNQNAQQASTIAGNAAMHGAYGGDREAVAQALAAQQENLAQAPTLAQVQQQGFQGAQGEFNTQQQQQLAAEQANAWLASQAGFGLAGLGNQAMTEGLTGANALLSSGALQQQLAQEQMNVPYQQFIQQQAYPYQQLGFLAPIVEGTGSLSGGTGSTTTPGPSALSQIGGLGLAGLGLVGLGNQQGWFDSGSGGDWFTGGGGGDILQKQGGRVGYAMGGATMPLVPGVGQGVPQIDLTYIPQQAPGAFPNAMMGLSPFQPDVEQTTQTSGGGIGGILGPLISIGKFAAGFFADGGRTHRDEGGGIGASNTAANHGFIGLPPVPSINLDYIANPGPVVKGGGIRGSGPPSPPHVAAPQDQGISGLMNEAKGLKDLGLLNFGSSGGSGAEADGGRASLQSGGVPVSVAAQYGGAPPTVTGAMQQLMELPIDRLEQMAVQFPPTTQQGQMVAQALSRKKATIGAGTAQPAPQGGMMATGLGTSPTPPSATAQSPQDYGGTAHAMADGGAANGAPGFVTEDELDPHPIVDHSGDTVKIRYPSEGKVLDLGIPSIKSRHLAAGGSSGAPPTFPQVSWANGQWSVADAAPPVGSPHLPVLGPANNAPLLGTAQAENVPGTTAPFTSSLPTANGVAVPQLSASAFAPPTSAVPGEGLPGWMQPLAQYRPPGAGPIGPGGTMVFPSTTAFTPQSRGMLTALGFNQTPVWAGGSPVPAGTAPAAAPTASPTPSPEDQLAQLEQTLGITSPGDKRGGRVARAEGGTTEQPASDQSALSNLGRIIGEGGYVSPSGGAWNASEQMRRELQAKVHPGFEGGGEVPPVPVAPTGGLDESLMDKLKRLEDLHRENVEDPFPSFRRIIGVPTGRPGGGGFSDGGEVEDSEPPPFNPSEFIEPPGIGYRAPPAMQRRDEYLPPKRPSFRTPERYADGGDAAEAIPDDAVPDAAATPAVMPAPPADAFGDVGRPIFTPAGFPVDEPLGTKVGRALRGDKPLIGERHEEESPFTPAPLPASAPPDRLADERAIGIGATGGLGTGEPAAPAAMVTPDRAPPTSAPILTPTAATEPETPAPSAEKPAQAPAAPVAPETAAVPAAAATTPKNWLAVGDSIGTGYIRYGGVSGKWAPNAKDLDADSGVGRTPQQVLDFIASRPKGYFAGKPVVLSSGVSNDPSQIGLVPQQIAALKAAGATSVVLSGVGDREGTEAGQHYDLRPYNPQLEDYAKQAGAQFGGPLPAVVHPAQGYYKTAVGKFGEPVAAPVPAPSDQVIRGRTDTSTPAPEGMAPATPTWTWERASPLIQQYESEGGKNIPNYRYDAGHTAFGPWQITDTNWRNIGPSVGVDLAKYPTTKSAPPELQEKVAHRLFDLDQFRGGTGFGDWAPYNAALAKALGGTQGTDQLVGNEIGRPGITPASAALGQASDLAQHALANTPPEHRSAMRQWMNSPYFLAFLAGAGMLASRSPFPGVALGEGLKLAGQGAMTMGAQDYKQQLAEARTSHLNDITNLRTEAATQRAEQNKQMMDYRLQNLLRLQQSHQDSLDLRQQIAAANIAAKQANLELAAARVETGIYATPYYGPGPSDPNDPNSPKVGGTWYAPKNPNSGVQPTFLPGVGAAKAATLEERMAASGLAKDPADAARILADAKRDPDNFKKGATYTHLVGEEAKRLALTTEGMNLSDAQRTARAQRNVDAELARGAGVATAQRPTASATPPGQRPTAPQRPAQPAEVIQNGWRYRMQDGQYVPVGRAQ